MELSIKAEDVNKMVADAILNSAIGEQLKKIIDEQVEKLSTSWNNPMKAIIDNHIRDAIVAELRTTHQEAIAAAVQKQLAEKLTNDFIFNVMDEGLKARRY